MAFSSVLVASTVIGSPASIGRMVEAAKVESLAAANQLDSALERAKSIIDSDTKDSALLAMGIDISLSVGDLKTAEEWEALLREATGNGPDARYQRARRLLISFEELDSSQKAELGRIITELRAERPRWYPIVTLSARHAQLQGDARRALSDYQLAVDMGDRRVLTIQQLASLLYEFGRFDEAQSQLSSLSTEQITTPILDTMAIQIAVKQNLPAKALELAEQSVERFPEDPLRRLHLANLLMSNGKQEEALQILQQATEDFTDDPRVWTGLFTALSRAGKSDEARKTQVAAASSGVQRAALRLALASSSYSRCIRRISASISRVSSSSRFVSLGAIT
jgi:predicted Zn-dependent protease